MIYVISRKKIALNGYTQINSVKELRQLPKGSEVIIGGPAPLEFLDKDAMLTVAQEHNLVLKALQL